MVTEDMRKYNMWSREGFQFESKVGNNFSASHSFHMRKPILSLPASYQLQSPIFKFSFSFDWKKEVAAAEASAMSKWPEKTSSPCTTSRDKGADQTRLTTTTLKSLSLTHTNIYALIHTLWYTHTRTHAHTHTHTRILSPFSRTH